MKTKNILKALAFVMMMPTMLLTTACSNEDEAIVNNETTNKKGYPLQVTVNVTREGDATRATYDNENKKLSFSAGDKLSVQGYAPQGIFFFAGMLNYVPSTGKFSGTIYTQNEYSGTAISLFLSAKALSVNLLPAGYESYGYLSINNNNTDALYDDGFDTNTNYTLATSKATAVEQFSYEHVGGMGTDAYNGGFALRPMNAILNFTVTGLDASTSVDVSLTGGNVSLTGGDYNITGTVTTDADGKATFAAGVYVGIYGYEDLNNFSLTVGGRPITLVTESKPLTAGKIYNINRAAPPATYLSTINANYTASDGETLTGTLASNVKISIADGATVALNNVNINGTNDSNYKWAGITCEGDATIILSGTNTVKGFYKFYPGIQAAAGKTLIIKSIGSLTASSNGNGAGIGGGIGVACGNIEIQGGTITATGGEYAAGIGGDFDATCGNITISGGTVTATGGEQAAGIGGGRRGVSDASSCGNILISGGTVTATGGENAAGIGGGRGNSNTELSSCGTITITTGVTKVTATKGSNADNSIGAGNFGTCGTVTIGGNEGAITTSPYTYKP
jgi:hypothetical protein